MSLKIGENAPQDGIDPQERIESLLQPLYEAVGLLQIEPIDVENIRGAIKAIEKAQADIEANKEVFVS